MSECALDDDDARMVLAVARYWSGQVETKEELFKGPLKGAPRTDAIG